jgi:hypothetical protein
VHILGKTSRSYIAELNKGKKADVRRRSCFSGLGRKGWESVRRLPVDEREFCGTIEIEGNVR